VCVYVLCADTCVTLLCTRRAGKLNPQQAFMKGQLKIKGNMMLAQKLGKLTAQKSAL